METVTLSSKYQIVLPKRLRRSLDLQPGQKLRISAQKNGLIEINSRSALDDLYGSVKGKWGGSPTTYVRQQRDEWESHQQQLDGLRK